MQVLSVILFVIAIALNLIVAPLLAWQGICIASGMRKYRRFPRKDSAPLSYAVIVCARNESNVIGTLLDSLTAQDYPDELYETFVVADNCTDDTAEIARSHGATVWVRDAPIKVGKGYALNFATRQLADYGRTFDAICVFDADNIAAPDFLTQIDKAMVDGVDGVTGYRDSKNAHASSLSEVYTIYWYMLMRFYHNARMHLGLSCFIGGTGFVFRTSSIPRGIWETSTITEDLEFTVQRVLEGRRIIFSYDAVFFDEQPEDLACAWTQMKRWMMGPKQIFWRYWPRLFRGVRSGSRESFNLLAQALIPLMVTAPIVATVLFPISFFISGNTTMGAVALLFFWLFLIVQVLFMFGTGYLTLRMNFKDPALYRRGMYAYPSLLFLSAVSGMAVALLPNNSLRWIATRHQDRISNEDLPTNYLR